ncbi:MAG: hypothetical protein A2Z29_08110 [Chloroflexi bacterium RBG_16_56_11]|nr:MAG: hypothetical protein A2Z29_08110 [Chloroflexi bacterium RBG_16_56_11]
MRRTLLLDEDDLIMVVKEDVVKMIDENRGEMTRTEFVNYLIQCQLHEHQNQSRYTSRQEFEAFSQKITDLLHNFLQFFVSYGLAMGRGQPDFDIDELKRQLESFYKGNEETTEP